MPRGPRLIPLLLLAVVSGILVYLAFPPVDIWPLSFIALVPLFIAIQRAPSRKAAALCAAVAGLVAYVPGLLWLASVTVLGSVGLGAYLASYIIAVSLLARHFGRRLPTLWPLPIAIAWAGLEVIRAEVATGFPYLIYGYTQYHTPLVQLSALTGVYGVSFLLVLLNAALAQAYLMLRQGGPEAPPARMRAWASLAFALAVLCVATAGSSLLAKRVKLTEGPVVGVVQHNAPRSVADMTTPPDVAALFRREEEIVKSVKQRSSPLPAQQKAAILQELSEIETKLKPYYDKVYGSIRKDIEKAVALSESLQDSHMRLLAWPETTVQVPLNIAPELNPDERSRAIQEDTITALKRLGAQMDCYMLIGSSSWYPRSEGYVTRVYYSGEVKNYGNSVVLFTPQGEFVERYDKMHLVPFGEYVPLKDYLPFLQVFTPLTRNITPGDKAVIFELPSSKGESVRFGALICYEDVVAPLVRNFRRHGAQFFVNATDEGWYRIPGELRQHLAMAVFRAVETRTTVVRAANTGISCFINPRGEIYGVVEKAVNGRMQQIDVAGALAKPVYTCDIVTPYVRYGDVFGWGCVAVTAAALITTVATRRKASG